VIYLYYAYVRKRTTLHTHKHTKASTTSTHKQVKQTPATFRKGKLGNARHRMEEAEDKLQQMEATLKEERATRLKFELRLKEQLPSLPLFFFSVYLLYLFFSVVFCCVCLVKFIVSFFSTFPVSLYFPFSLPFPYFVSLFSIFTSSLFVFSVYFSLLIFLFLFCVLCVCRVTFYLSSSIFLPVSLYFSSSPSFSIFFLSLFLCPLPFSLTFKLALLVLPPLKLRHF
jgi:hypothetical protein